MIKLILDTSNQYLAVGLYKDNICLEKIQEDGSLKQSEYAIPTIKKVLDLHNLSLLDIDEMVITRGPGSYTGVRVAMTIAKTLNAIKPITLKAISSLKAYAGLNKCVSIIDARSKKVFICAYNEGKELCQEIMIPIEELDNFINKYPDFKIVGQQKDKVDLIDNLYKLSINEESVDNVDALVPRYIKDIEVKKICL